MNDIKVGKQIQNQNGKIYTVLACKGERALLVGGWDYVVIDDLNYFMESGNWGGGKYFPFFEDDKSIEMLNQAFYYFNNYEYGVYMATKNNYEED